MLTPDSVSSIKMAASSKLHAECTCGAHFYELEQAQASPLAPEALQRIGALYGIEEQIWGKPLDQCRAMRRHNRSGCSTLCVRFETTLSKLSSKSDTTAIRYALSRWNSSTTDTSTSTTTPPSGLCAASPWAARTACLPDRTMVANGAAPIYSLIGSAKLNGLDSEAYLGEVLTRIADRPSTASTKVALESQLHIRPSVRLTDSAS